MNVSGSTASIERFQAAILAAKKKNVAPKAEAMSKMDKLTALQETIKAAKKVKPASVSGTAFNKIYGKDSQIKSKVSTPKLGLQFDVYA